MNGRDSQSPAAWQPGQPYTVILWYRYAQLGEGEACRLVSAVTEACQRHGLAGRVLLAPEGVNGTLAGSEPCIQAFIDFFEGSHPAFKGIDWKRSHGAAQRLPFPDLSVKQLREIINTGTAKGKLDQFIQFDPATFGGLAHTSTGTHLTPSQFHHMLQASTPGCSEPVQQPQASCSSTSSSQEGAPLIIDVRNQYEYEAGHFQGAVPLEVNTYCESWALLDKLIEQHQLRTTNKPVLMYCTGGIRCEKASAYMRASGIEGDRVFQLQGGIHRYMEEFKDGGLFMGKNVVFDARCSMAPETAAPDASAQADAACAASAAALPCVHCPETQGLTPGRCSVCNAVVLVCQPCLSQHCSRGEFHCRRHAHLKALYFKDLTRFTWQELQQQAEGLRVQLAGLQGTEKKGRRRTLRKQLERVEAQQGALASPAAC